MKSSARWPLMLLLVFITFMAGVVIWASLSNPDTPPSDDARNEKKTEATKTSEVKSSQSVSIELKPATADEAPKTPSKSIKRDLDALPAPAPAVEPRLTRKNLSTGSKVGKLDTLHPAEKERLLAAPAARERKASDFSAAAPVTKRRDRPDSPLMPKALPHIAPNDSPPVTSDPGLDKKTAIAPLPQIGVDKRQPLDVFAKPFNKADKRPRIGIVVTGLGLSDAATESAIQGLSGSITLAFAPYSSKLNEWIRLARAGGHEVLINVPMEPVNYPEYDPGPYTLLTSLDANENLDRLSWALNRATGYVGVVDFLGSRFTSSEKHMGPVLSALKKRGLLYLDSGSATRSIVPAVARELIMTYAVSTLTLDARPSRKNIDRKFGELERYARTHKKAIGIASPYPVTLERIANWTRQLRARGFALAPVTALANDSKTTR